MAIRNILNEKEDVLHKVSRPVTDFDERLWQLLAPMPDTLHRPPCRTRTGRAISMERDTAVRRRRSGRGGSGR